MKYTFFDSLGRQLGSVESDSMETVEANTPANATRVEGLFDKDDYLLNGVVLSQPVKPGKSHRWNQAAKQWEDPRTPADIKASQWLKIKAMRDARKSGGFKVGAKWFHSDEPSRSQYAILLITALEKLLLDSYVFNAAWKDMSGKKEPLTVGMLRQIRDAGLALEATLFAVAEAHRASMESAPNPESYDFTTGWPAIYGETP